MSIVKTHWHNTNKFTVLETHKKSHQPLDRVLAKTRKTGRKEPKRGHTFPRNRRSASSGKYPIHPEVSGGAGHQATAQRKELIGLCPFHEDRNPSLNIDPVQNVWQCKGACGEGGDVIEWVRRAEGISFTHAVEPLKRPNLPSASSTAELPPKTSTVPKLPPLFQANVDDQKLLGIVVDYYHATLKQTPGAQQYLIQRG
jgi:hypothetical protein